MERGNAKTYDNTAENTHLQGSYSESGGGRVGREGIDTAPRGDKGTDGGIHYQVTDSARESRHLFFLFRHTDSYAHSEEQGKVVEDNASRSAHNAEDGVEQTALADQARKSVSLKRGGVGEGASDAEKESRNGKQSDRQHKRAPDSLKYPEYLVFHKIFSFEKSCSCNSVPFFWRIN